MGLLDMMGQGDSTFSKWIEPRRNAITGFGMGMIGGSPQERMRGALSGAMQGRELDTEYGRIREEQEQREQAVNQTTEWIQSMAQQNPGDQRWQALAQGLSSQAIDPSAAFTTGLEYMQPQGGAGEASFSQTPVFLTDDQGNQVIGQMSSGGGVLVNGQVVNSLPEGWRITARPDNFDRTDLGSGYGTFNPNTGTFSGPQVPISGAPSQNQDVTLGPDGARTMAPAAGSPEALERGQQGGNAIANAELMLSQIDGVLNDPNLGQAVGIGGILPAIPGTAQAGTVSRIEQLQGQAFLQAFEALKGAGQITEVEGRKAEQATARLQRAQTLEDYTAALRELREVVAAGLERARTNYGMEPTTTSTGVTWSF